MCETSQLRFINGYDRASRDLRLQIDQAFSLYQKQRELLGVVSLFGQTASGEVTTVNIGLDPASFSTKDFTAAVNSFATVELCILLVRAESVYPPLAALQLLADQHPKCEVIRVSTANMSFEFRPLDRLIEFASAQVTRCGCCSRSATCSSAAMHVISVTEVRAAS